MRAVVIGTAEGGFGHAAAAAAALRFLAAGPVAVIGARGFPRPPVAPLPTAGALRAGAFLRAAGIRAAARWRLVVCETGSLGALEEAEAAALEACGVSVTALCSPDRDSLGAGYDLAVPVLPAGCPEEMCRSASQGWSRIACEVVPLRLAEPGHGRILPLAGICPPPVWSEELDRLFAVSAPDRSAGRR